MYLVNRMEGKIRHAALLVRVEMIDKFDSDSDKKIYHMRGYIKHLLVNILLNRLMRYQYLSIHIQ